MAAWATARRQPRTKQLACRAVVQHLCAMRAERHPMSRPRKYAARAEQKRQPLDDDTEWPEWTQQRWEDTPWDDVSGYELTKPEGEQQ